MSLVLVRMCYAHAHAHENSSLIRCVAARDSGDVMKAFTLQSIVLQYPPLLHTE